MLNRQSYNEAHRFTTSKVQQIMTSQATSSHSTPQFTTSDAQPIETASPNRRLLVIFSLLVVYIVWGTTYLGIRFALESFPPYFLMGSRFLAAGGLLFVFLRARGAPMPTRVQWRSAAIVAVLLLVFGMGSVALAEQSVSSGLTATLVATSPLWALLFSMLWGGRPQRIEWAGVALGIAGVALLSREGALQANPAGIALVMFATIAWSLGSIWSRHLPMPKGAMGNAAEMLIGGVILTVLSVVRGEHLIGTPTVSASAALIYLIVFGSLLTLTAYMYLLDTVHPTLATSYAFVNPPIALFLGVLLGGEHLTGSALLALPVIFAALLLISLRKNDTKRVH